MMARGLTVRLEFVHFPFIIFYPLVHFIHFSEEKNDNGYQNNNDTYQDE